MNYEKQIEKERLKGKLEAAIIALDYTDIDVIIESLKTIYDEHISQSV